MTSKSIIHTNLHKPTRSWLMHGSSTFGAWTSHGHTWTHKTHHGLDLGEATTFTLILFFVPSHKGCIWMLFCPRIPNLGLLWLWSYITFCANLQLGWGLKQSYSPHQKLLNDMWHITYAQVNQGNSWLLMIESQIEIWLSTFFLAITCVLSNWMGHVNPF
jgi:hypothetical protein